MQTSRILRKWFAVGIILLFIGTASIPSSGQKIEKLSARGHWLYVGGSGPGNYTKIQDAIDNASDGDTIYVYNGTYFENIVLDKAIKLLGDNKNNTIIDGSDGNNSIIIIKANDVYIGGFTIRNSSPFYRGIFFQPNYTRVAIIDNIIKNNRGAILLESSSNSNISRNIIIDCYSNPAIELTTYLTGNSSYNTISRNIFINNNENKTESISLIFSSHNKIINNIIDQSSTGISVAFSSDYNDIIANKIKNCESYGIYIQGASSNEVRSNTISDNYHGIDVIWYSDYNNITNNTISNNIRGIFVDTKTNSSNNTIYHNNFLHNNVNAYAYDPISTWNNEYPSGGNFWSDYTGTDANGDGIGDTPHNISGGSNQDHYPLMLPYSLTKLAITFQPSLFKLALLIKNIGNTTALNVQWNMSITGFVLSGKEASGFLPNLLPGKEIRVSAIKLLIGLGRITITARAWAENAPGVSAKIHGILILWFFRIMKK